MTAPVVGTKNDGQTSGSNPLSITLTNAPSAGGLAVILCGIYTGNTGGADSVSATYSGGSGVTVTKQYDGVGTANQVTGVLIWTVEYTTAPTSVTISRSGTFGGDPPYISASVVNITGQNASFLDGCNGSTGSSATPVATALPDLTDASDLVLGCMTRNSSDGTTVSAGTGWTETTEIDETNATYVTLNVIQRTPGATGSYDPTWSLGGSPGTDTWFAAGISIKGTGGGGGGGVASSSANAPSGMSAMGAGLSKAGFASGLSNMG